ncbi:MAG: NAD(P)H-hydrate epimerase [Candidatus Omnitrophica bacterium]|nr:NAD(P)H-hydrate epimerase [Candidatus Omnitrophota bacterium]
MRAADRLAQERFGVPDLILMEHAGWAVADIAKKILKKDGKKGAGNVVIFSGRGANGGDGFVAARSLDNSGIPVEVVFAGDPGLLSGASRINFNILRKSGIRIHRTDSVEAWRRWCRRDHSIRLAVDALLGTGFTGPLREPILSIIRWLNSRSFPVVAVDIPSGLSADTGDPFPEAVKADVTVTCGFPKVGLKRGRGPSYAGRIVVADISLPRKVIQRFAA